MTDDDPDLDTAYALKTPEDSVRLYRDWAATYDSEFAVQNAYDYPEKIAALFEARARSGDAPILDVGCGTGLVAAAMTSGPIDGIDISAEMLAVASEKAIYRTLIEGDLTATLDIPDAVYGGMISAGTFTHGHVGPEALDELVRIGRRDALFVLGVNAQVFEGQNFGDKVAALERAGAISAPEFVDGPIFGEGADHEHGGDIYRALVFRRA